MLSVTVAPEQSLSRELEEKIFLGEPSEKTLSLGTKEEYSSSEPREKLSFEINGNTMTVDAEGMEGEQTANIVELDDHNLELNLTGRVNLSYAWTDINITFKYTR